LAEEFGEALTFGLTEAAPERENDQSTPRQREATLRSIGELKIRSRPRVSATLAQDNAIGRMGSTEQGAAPLT